MVLWTSWRNIEIWKLGIYGKFEEEQRKFGNPPDKSTPTLNESTKKDFNTRIHTKNNFHKFSFIHS